MLLNKIIFTPSLQIASNILRNNHTNIKIENIIYDDRFVINHYFDDGMNVVRIWKTKSLFDIWYDEMCGSNFIACLDYTINNDHIKIDYMNINDDNCIIKNKYKLNNSESSLINNSLIEYLKIVAKENNKNKIIVDVHNNLSIYRLYYKDEGFIINSINSIDNPYWVEAELHINP